MKAQIKAIVASAVVIALCLAAVGGVTYSWFSDTEQSEITVNAAEIDLKLDNVSGTLKSHGLSDNVLSASGGSFPIGGTVSIGSSTPTPDSTTYRVTVDQIAPGDSVDLILSGTLKNTIRTSISVSATISENDLPYNGDKLTVTSPICTVVNGTSRVVNLNDIPATSTEKDVTVTTTIALDKLAGNDYQKRQFLIELTVIAIQMNYDTFISTAEEFRAFATSVNEGGKTYSGKTVTLGANIDLENVPWTPVGQTGATQFMGTFDGQNHTISNLKINNTDEGGNCSTGIFGWLNSATVKNLNVVNANVTGHHNVGVIAGYMETSGCTIENCHVTNATVSCTSVNGEANGDKVGVIVGHAGNTGVVVKDCTATNSTVSAGRDAGQCVGAALTANVTDCSATGVTVTANGTSTGANIRNEVIGRIL